MERFIYVCVVGIFDDGGVGVYIKVWEMFYIWGFDV